MLLGVGCFTQMSPAIAPKTLPPSTNNTRPPECNRNVRTWCVYTSRLFNYTGSIGKERTTFYKRLHL